MNAPSSLELRFFSRQLRLAGESEMSDEVKFAASSFLILTAAAAAGTGRKQEKNQSLILSRFHMV